MSQSSAELQRFEKTVLLCLAVKNRTSYYTTELQSYSSFDVF